MLVLAAIATRARAGTFDDGVLLDDGAVVPLDDPPRDDAGHELGVGRFDDIRGVDGADDDAAATHALVVPLDDTRAIPGPGVPRSAVIAAALRTAGLADDPVPGWRRRSRWSALIPSVSARVGNSQSWRDVIDPTVSHAMSYDVRASWRLERLLFDSNEPRFSAFDMSRRRERRRLVAIVGHLHAVWVSATASAAATDDPLRDRRALMQAARATAELDAFTDGWFSDVVAKSSRSR